MRKEKWKIVFEFLMISIGAIIAAFSIEEFLVPCTILDGGIVGVGIIINNLAGIKLGIVTFILNIPFLIVGSKKLGHIFIIKSTYAMMVFSVFLEIFAGFVNATAEYLLAVCFGGVLWRCDTRCWSRFSNKIWWMPGRNRNGCNLAQQEIWITSRADCIIF